MSCQSVTSLPIMHTTADCAGVHDARRCGMRQRPPPGLCVLDVDFGEHSSVEAVHPGFLAQAAEEERGEGHLNAFLWGQTLISAAPQAFFNIMAKVLAKMGATGIVPNARSGDGLFSCLLLANVSEVILISTEPFLWLASDETSSALPGHLNAHHCHS